MEDFLDVAALSKKYADERQKRLERGNRASLDDPAAIFPEISIDPWVKERDARQPVIIEVDALTTGCGMAGILAAVNLAKAGVTNIAMVDTAGDFGGTWYWNRYPGIRCDIESYIYMPLLEEVGTIPSERYASGEEIRNHLQNLARKFDLYAKAFFQTAIVSATWNEDLARWIVRTDRGDELKARFLLGTSGFLHRPKLPDIPGISTFGGRIFHPSRWDYDYTGGEGAEVLSGLKGKRVGLIGTGATGIQILPHLAMSGAQTYLFQRTPAAVSARNNIATDQSWFVRQSAGWQAERMNLFEAITQGAPDAEDVIDDCWTRTSRKLRGVQAGSDQSVTQSLDEALQRYDFELMQSIRDDIQTIVNDPCKAESLKPWYNLFCKRPLYADD